MLNPALRDLIRLQNRAAFRNLWKTVKTPSGFFLTLMLVGLVALGVLPSLMLALFKPDAFRSPLTGMLSGVFPIMFYVTASFMISRDLGKTLMELRPPELQFVLAGPFTNHEILTYRFRVLGVSWLWMSLIFSFLLLPNFGSYLGGFLGILLGGGFVFSLGFFRSLLTPRLSKHAANWISNTITLSHFVLACEFAFRGAGNEDIYSLQGVHEVAASCWSVKALGWIFLPFVNVMTAEMGLAMIPSAIISLGMLVIGICACYYVNDGFSELAVEGVARRKTKLDRFKSGNLFRVSSRRVQRQSWMPSFGWWGGAGSVAWSQLVIASRMLGRTPLGLFGLSVLVAIAIAVLLRTHPGNFSENLRSYSVPIAMALSAYLGFIMLVTVQSGFSMNARILTWYKVMPVKPMPLAVGMIAGAASILGSLRIAFFLPALVMSSNGWLENAAILFASLVVDVVFVSVQNFIPATTGLRLRGDGPPDVLQGARAIVFMLVVGLAMLPLIAIAGIAVAIAGAWLGMTWTVCTTAVGLSLLLTLPAIWWITGTRFLDRED